MNESLIPQSLVIALPPSAKNPVDVYITPEITSNRIATALEAADSKSTATAYARQLGGFAEWLGEEPIAYATLTSYRAHLRDAGKSPQNVNQALAAIRFYSKQAVSQGWMTPEQLAALKQVEALKIKGRKLGNWLTIEEAQKLLSAPAYSTATGLRDRAVLALLVGAGLRRSEVCALQVKHFEQRDGGEGKMRWLLIGVTGKHGRTRNIPIADWVKGIVDKWLERGRVRGGFVFRTVHETPFRIGKDAISPALIYKLVQVYGKKIGRPILAPHDLRRTFARLAFEGDAPIVQIKESLGHASIEVTERYVNKQQDIQIAPGDVLGLNVEV